MNNNNLLVWKAPPAGPAERERLPRAEERALLAGARRGDRRSVRRLLERLSRPIYRFGRGFCRNSEDAEDVMQEVLASLARTLPRFRGDASLTTWAYAVARNACIRHRHRYRREVTSLDERSSSRDGEGIGSGLVDRAADPERDLLRRELDGALRIALATLPAAEREAVLLRDVEGLTLPDVARVLGIGERTAKSRVHRGREGLRTALSGLGHGRGPAPGAGPGGCPDTARLLSRYLEGDLDASHCAALSEHVARCSSCGRACRELQRSLHACRRYGRRALPRRVREGIRRSIAAVLVEQRNPLS
jgi:RNA polymerase sigma-70 factor (ECF subfamily)